MNLGGTWNWEEIVDSINTDVIVSDAKGNIVYSNSSVEHWLNIKQSEIIGRSVIQMEKEKIFYPSVVKRVLETGEKQTLIQETRSGKKLLVTGNIVYDDKQNIKYVVTYSQDVTELEKMKLYVKIVEGEMETIKSEMRELQSRQQGDSRIITKSKEMKHVVDLIHRVARSDISVLLTGESGVGKTLLAEYLHNQSGRKGKFVTINCSSIPESLLESELFGYDAGAFTGANPKGKKGLVEEAKGGTLFLDEIGELPMNLQAKLLTFTQSKEFFRVGETKPITLDFRLVTATNVNLKEKIEKGEFREDLYFRLSVIHIPIPPLRERREDLLSLIIELTQKFNQRHHQEKVLDHSVIDHLLKYKWPGNVRELANLMERLILTVEDTLIEQRHLPEEFVSIHRSEDHFGFHALGDKSLPKKMEAFEAQILKNALERYSSTTEMSRYLGVSQPTVVRKLQKYGIKRES